MSEKNPAPPKESRQIPPHSDGEVSNPAPPAERCAKCGHDVERHEEAPTANQPYCWDCPPPECYHIAPAPLADGGKTVFDGYPLSRAEYVERIHEGGRGGYGIATHDVLMHHDAALRAALDKAKEALMKIRDGIDGEYIATQRGVAIAANALAELEQTR